MKYQISVQAPALTAITLHGQILATGSYRDMAVLCDLLNLAGAEVKSQNEINGGDPATLGGKPFMSALSLTEARHPIFPYAADAPSMLSSG